MIAAFPPDVASLLINEGWSPERRLPTGAIEAVLTERGFVVHRAAVDFLASFTGIPFQTSSRTAVYPGFWLGVDERESDDRVTAFDEPLLRLFPLYRRVVAQAEGFLGAVTPIAYCPATNETWYMMSSGQIVAWNHAIPCDYPIVELGRQCSDAVENYLAHTHRLTPIARARPIVCQLQVAGHTASPCAISTAQLVRSNQPMPLIVELEAFGLPSFTEHIQASLVDSYPRDIVSVLQRLASQDATQLKKSILIALQTWIGFPPSPLSWWDRLFGAFAPPRPQYSWDTITKIELDKQRFIFTGTCSLLD